MTGRAAGNGIRHTEHHRTGRIEDPVGGAIVRAEPLATERHGIIVTYAALDAALDPQHTACGNISFQSRNSCLVGVDELVKEMIIPVKNDHSIIVKVKPSQLRGRKHAIGVPVSRDRTLNHRCHPRVMRLENGEVMWRWLAGSKGVLDSIIRDLRIVLRRETQDES